MEFPCAWRCVRHICASSSTRARIFLCVSGGRSVGSLGESAVVGFGFERVESYVLERIPECIGVEIDDPADLDDADKLADPADALQGEER